MFKKFGIGMLAVVMALAFSAFTAAKKTAPATGFTQTLYWYEVVNGVIPQNQPLHAYDMRANVSDYCDQLVEEIACLRGFEEPQDTSGGPITAAGVDDILKDDPNTP